MEQCLLSECTTCSSFEDESLEKRKKKEFPSYFDPENLGTTGMQAVLIEFIPLSPPAKFLNKPAWQRRFKRINPNKDLIDMC
jgi:hypothetical protein